MKNKLNYDICIIGAGAGGLSVASAASQLGVTVALIEADKMGGDCLNYGCVPSKALLSIAKHYYQVRNSEQYGFVASAEPIIIKNVMQKVKEVINTIAPHDSVERFTSLGAIVFKGIASFVNANTVVVNDNTISAKRFIIASGSSPVTPSIPGLEAVSFFTNETIFDLSDTPTHLAIIGGGPIGCEMASAFAMLGIPVTLFSHSQILPKDEADLVAILRTNMQQQGANIIEDSEILNIEKLADKQIQLTYKKNDQQGSVVASHLLVATGRTPNITNLNLVKAGIEYTNRGIAVDYRLRTTNKNVFAIGDVTGSFLFTHIASYHAGIVIKNILFKIPTRVKYLAVPWVTYTNPELAHVGMNYTDAVAKYSNNLKITELNYSESDRAQTERATNGKIKLITTKKGQVLGVSIIGVNAGELIFPWIDLINGKKSIREFTRNIIPYPTFSELNKFIASEFYRPVLFSATTKKVVKFLKLFW
jgi:pyruvate/2-oxoglutarate dehydrogenase complex dihydrolipoamide dehydrogenase (E3) component